MSVAAVPLRAGDGGVVLVAASAALVGGGEGPGEGEELPHRRGAMGSDDGGGAPRHLSFWALSATDGALLWAHTGDGGVSEEAPGEVIQAPAHQYRVSREAVAAARERRRWRAHRAGILSAGLPHAWAGRDDTVLGLAHFERPRDGGGDRGTPLSAVPALRDDIPAPASAAALRPAPRRSRTPHAEAEHVAAANVLLAHGSRGVEALHLASGRPLAALALPRAGGGGSGGPRGASGGVYADVNGDGAIDRVDAVAYRLVGTTRVPACVGLVMSGTPATEVLYNASICDAGVQGGSGSLDAAVPALLRDAPRAAAGGAARGSWLMVFLASTGRLTGVRGRDGGVAWGVDTRAVWARGGLEGRHVGALPVSLDARAEPDAATGCVLVVAPGAMGLYAAVDGGVLAKVDVAAEDGALATPVLGDFNGDGTTDVVVVTAAGLIGYAVHVHRGSWLLLAAFGVLLVPVVLGVAWRAVTDNNRWRLRVKRSGRD